MSFYVDTLTKKILFILKQNGIDQLDDVLTYIFKHEIPYYEFRSLQTEIYPLKECEYLPTTSIVHYISLCVTI